MRQPFFAAIAALSVALAPAAIAKELRLGMSAPEATPWGVSAKAMAARVEELTGGDLKISVYFSNELGDGQTMARQIARGRLDMGVLSNIEASLILPEFGLLNAPFLFNSVAQADCTVDRFGSGTFDEAFKAAGAVYLAPIEIGGMVIMGKTPFRTPADIANQKIRTSPAPTDTYYIEATGAAAVPLSVPETMPALKTGGVVGLTAPIIMGVAGGYYAEAPEFVLTNHTYQIGALLISKRVWDGLDETQQNALQESVKAMDGLRAGVRAAEQALLAKAKAAGANVTELSESERDSWKVLAPAVQDRIVQGIGGNASEIWQNLQTASAACAQ